MEKEQKLWLTIGLVGIVVLLAVYVIGSFGGLTGSVILASDATDVVRIGFMAPLTGDAASYGESIKRGVELARKDSGLNNIEITFEDSGCEPKGAVNSINKLISVNRVQAIVGEVCSGATLAAAPIAERNDVVLISSSSTSPKITEAGDYIFRTVPSDALQGNFGAQLVYEKGYRKLAILYSNEEYGLGFNNVLVDRFQGQVVTSEAFERGASDLRTQLTKIKNSGADSIYIISNSPDSSIAALKQIKELGLNIKLFGSEGLKSADILEAGSAAEGLILTTVSSGTTDFAENHKRVYGEEPGPFAAQAYDAFMAVAKAIKQGAKTGAEIKDALYDIEFNGASGRIEFDRNGDVSGNYNVFEVRGGKFVAVE
ncbi:MAG: penicillin-binding protein activator [Nanoarchaeota archaeon]|nr:penicillin-binding protein activator [Nanoarchaeota archaeon]